MAGILKWLVLACCLFTPAGFIASNAQQQDSQPVQDTEQATQQETQQGENQSDAQQEDNSATLPDIDSEPIQAGAGGPGRFIPSEQISQDSGVSFPVDI
jgi:hypothetical protein